MGDKNAGQNFPKARRETSPRESRDRYNTAGYYQPNSRLGDARGRKDLSHDDEDQYDDFNSGKMEDYDSQGYYGSNYGSISDWKVGRDIERNAGYRDSYAHLTAGQWPEVQEAADRRGIDLHWRELQARGVHRGKGPRAYQRSDYRISEDIYDVLFEDRYIDATDIEIKVESGEVVLSGQVESRHIKRRVEDVIEAQVSGIRHLENRIKVRQPGGSIVDVRRNSG